MKKIIFILFALPLIFVACGEKDIDRGLDGTWIGEVETSDLTVLSAIGSGEKANDKSLKETLIYKIDGKSVQTYRSKNYQTMENQIEVEIGTYHRSDDVVVFDISKHSCAKLESARPLTRRIIYKFSDDLSKVTFTFGPNKNVTFKRLNKDEANSMDQIVANAITGCFVQGSFKQGKVEKPEENLSVSQKVDELESETQKALKDEGIESKDASLDVKANKSGTTEL